MTKWFIDTNVLIYSLGSEPENEPKYRRAVDVLAEGDWCLSVQVLQEFYVQAVGPSRPGAISQDLAMVFIREFSSMPVQPMTLDLYRSALATCQRYQISYWDAAIIEAARALGCRTVYSEDMQHGQDYGGVRVVDPFR
jgi:predicted nucleic acid-binding protein